MEWTEAQRRAFAELMQSARARTGLKQFEVAERLGISPGTISQLERGPFMGMRWVDVVRLCAFYELSADHLCAALGIATSPAARDAAATFALDAELEGLSPAEQEEVRKVVRLLIRGLRAGG